MSEQRLSKLQKWILCRCYEDPDLKISKYHIYKDFFKIESGYVISGPSVSYKSKSSICVVVLSRSLKRLREKELIKDHYYRNEMILTNVGIEKVKSLMLITKGINNKKKEMKNERIKRRNHQN